jgi:DNA ligase (NAD+)
MTLEELRGSEVETLTEVEDVGPEVAESVAGFFGGRGRGIVADLLAHGVEPRREEREDTFEGTTVVFTGSIEGYTRKELTETLERHGAEVTSSVSGETDYLIVGENPGTTKRQDAEEYGVETLDEEEFRERFLEEI